MKTFALDCAQNGLCLALIENDRLLAGRAEPAPAAHSVSLLKTIHAFLRDAAVALPDITRVLYFNGPGSFTSLRIGLATLAGLFLGRPDMLYCESSSLRLRCLSVSEGQGRPVEVWMRAGRERVYRGRLDAAGEFSEEALSLTAALQSAGSASPPGILAGDGLMLLSEAELVKLRGLYEAVVPGEHIQPEACLEILRHAEWHRQGALPAARLNYLLAPDIG